MPKMVMFGQKKLGVPSIVRVARIAANNLMRTTPLFLLLLAHAQAQPGVERNIIVGSVVGAFYCLVIVAVVLCVWRQCRRAASPENLAPPQSDAEEQGLAMESIPRENTSHLPANHPGRRTGPRPQTPEEAASGTFTRTLGRIRAIGRIRILHKETVRAGERSPQPARLPAPLARMLTFASPQKRAKHLDTRRKRIRAAAAKKAEATTTGSDAISPVVTGSGKLCTDAATQSAATEQVVAATSSSKLSTTASRADEGEGGSAPTAAAPAPAPASTSGNPLQLFTDRVGAIFSPVTTPSKATQDKEDSDLTA